MAEPRDEREPGLDADLDEARAALAAAVSYRLEAVTGSEIADVLDGLLSTIRGATLDTLHCAIDEVRYLIADLDADGLVLHPTTDLLRTFVALLTVEADRHEAELDLGLARLRSRLESVTVSDTCRDALRRRVRERRRASRQVSDTGLARIAAGLR